MIEVARQHGFELWSAFGCIHLGRAQTRLGEVEEGIENMKKGLGAYSGTGGKLWTPYFLGLLAAALGESGRAAEGLEVIEKAIRISESNDELFSTAELCRVHGELLLKTDNGAAKARECFLTSLELSQSQQLKSWQLRTLMSIHRHRLTELVPDADLSGCYASFNEGFDTADLEEAKMILAAE